MLVLVYHPLRPRRVDGAMTWVQRRVDGAPLAPLAVECQMAVGPTDNNNLAGLLRNLAGTCDPLSNRKCCLQRYAVTVQCITA